VPSEFLALDASSFLSTRLMGVAPIERSRSKFQEIHMIQVPEVAAAMLPVVARVKRFATPYGGS
jgi:hypothetical protein